MLLCSSTALCTAKIACCTQLLGVFKLRKRKKLHSMKIALSVAGLYLSSFASAHVDAPSLYRSVAAVYNDYMFVMGGKTSSESDFKDVYKLDLTDPHGKFETLKNVQVDGSCGFDAVQPKVVCSDFKIDGSKSHFAVLGDPCLASDNPEPISNRIKMTTSASSSTLLFILIRD